MVKGFNAHFKIIIETQLAGGKFLGELFRQLQKKAA
jgi:hypothetical protein